ncbi:VOC family protein [Arthrobacter mobilis]|uniref:Glyoxalase n=1 Tax=Arthrobacter mobilis TaxID=2724944 RepID=A0A7X6HBL8_9MICC|nr:VOC family protein [Arthrobacter mobilis]NKX54101.1 glyoxalase [Arthrobacter mobilis]
MKPLVTAVTLGVRDVRASRNFYIEGLGWQPLFAEEGEILFLQIAHGQMLALWNVESMRREYGDVGHHESGPAVPVSLGQNVDSPGEVDEAIRQALAAGATLVSEARYQPWGGYSGCFADPDGYRWDIVFNPGFSIGDDGTVHLGPAA